jgi:type I restriction enzyme S subunit
MEVNQTHIPEGWVLTSFGEKELFRIIGSGIKHFNGEKEYYSTSSIEGNRILFAEQLITFKNRPSRANMQPIENSVWFAKMKNTFKILKVTNREIAEVILSTGFSGIESYEVQCDYLMQILSSAEFNSQKNLLAEGSTQEAVNNTKIKEIKFLLPKSKTEQTQIASILTKVDEAITQTEQLIAKYTRIKTGLMQDLLTKGIDENGNIRSEETHEFKDSPLGRIPKEWEIKKMGDLILAIDPQPDHRTPAAVTDGIPYVGISDILENGEIDIKSCRKVGFNVLEKQQRLFKVDSGDLIFGKIGTIGKPKILPLFSKHPFTLSANIILIKPHECPDFVYWSLISKYVEDQVNLAIHSTSQPAFGMQKIRDLDIITPLPKERDRITSKLDKLNKVVQAEKIKLFKLQSFKTGLMQDLLSGKVRVNNLKTKDANETATI